MREKSEVQVSEKLQGEKQKPVALGWTCPQDEESRIWYQSSEISQDDLRWGKIPKQLWCFSLAVGAVARCWGAQVESVTWKGMPSKWWRWSHLRPPPFSHMTLKPFWSWNWSKHPTYYSSLSWHCTIRFHRWLSIDKHLNAFPLHYRDKLQHLFFFSWTVSEWD